MKTYRQVFVVLAVVIFITPQIALAAWWNPFTWKVFISNKAPKTQVQQIPKATTTREISGTKNATSTEGSKIKPVGKDIKVLKSKPVAIPNTTNMSEARLSANPNDMEEIVSCGGSSMPRKDWCSDGYRFACGQGCQPLPGTVAPEFMTCGPNKWPKNRMCDPGTEPRCTTEPPSYFVCDPITSAPIRSQAPKATATGENFREVAITTYKKTAEFFKRAIEETRTNYIPNIKERRSRLVSRVSLIRSSLFINSNSPDWLNKVFDLYAQEHEAEIKFIDDTLAYIESNLSMMTAYQADYDKNASLLLTDPNKFVSMAEIQALFEHEKNFIDAKYSGVENINKALSGYYQNVINREDIYANEYATIKSGLSRLTESTITSAPIYQPMPQSDPGLTARQQLMSSPITCTYMPGPSGGMAYATVQCN